MRAVYQRAASGVVTLYGRNRCVIGFAQRVRRWEATAIASRSVLGASAPGVAALFVMERAPGIDRGYPESGDERRHDTCQHHEAYRAVRCTLLCDTLLPANAPRRMNVTPRNFS